MSSAEVAGLISVVAIGTFSVISLWLGVKAGERRRRDDLAQTPIGRVVEIHVDQNGAYATIELDPGFQMPQPGDILDNRLLPEVEFQFKQKGKRTNS